jgi:hypothetical protein
LAKRDEDNGFTQFVRDLYEKQMLKKNGTDMKDSRSVLNGNSIKNREAITTIEEAVEFDGAIGDKNDDFDVALAEELGIDVELYMHMDKDDIISNNRDQHRDSDKYKKVAIGEDMSMESTANRDVDMDAITNERSKDVENSYLCGSHGMLMLLPSPSFGADLNTFAATYHPDGGTSDSNDSKARGDHIGHVQSGYGGDIGPGGMMSTPPLSQESIGLAI